MSIADDLKAMMKAMDEAKQFPETVAVTNDLARLKEYFKAESGTDMAGMICGYRVIESEFGLWPYTLLPASMFDKPKMVHQTATENELMQRVAEQRIATWKGWML